MTNWASKDGLRIQELVPFLVKCKGLKPMLIQCKYCRENVVSDGENIDILMELMIGREGNTEKKRLRKLMIKGLIKYRNKRKGNEIFRSVFFIKKTHAQMLKKLAKGLESSNFPEYGFFTME